jgi:hypothetical protein
MDHATCSRLLTATHFATSLLPLTARLLPVITELGRLIVHSRRADPTPGACHRFETRLQELLRELGRIIVEWTLNHLEPHDRKADRRRGWPTSLMAGPTRPAITDVC